MADSDTEAPHCIAADAAACAAIAVAEEGEEERVERIVAAQDRVRSGTGDAQDEEMAQQVH
eukprot:scaffold55355_cov24-Tisochrysis_lutea.AAC.1